MFKFKMPMNKTQCTLAFAGLFSFMIPQGFIRYIKLFTHQS